MGHADQRRHGGDRRVVEVMGYVGRMVEVLGCVGHMVEVGYVAVARWQFLVLVVCVCVCVCVDCVRHWWWDLSLIVLVWV